MLVGLVRLLRRRRPCTIRIQTPDGMVSKGLRAIGVDAGYKKSPADILRGLLWAECVVLGGGTIFHDAYPDERYRGYWRNLLVLALIFALARVLGRHVSLIGIGVGPLRRRRTRLFTTLLKWAAHDISVRDQPSADDLHSLPGRHGKVRVADDLSAFANFAALGVARSGRGIIGLSLVPPGVVSGADGGAVERFYDALGGQLGQALERGEISGVMLFSANVGKDSDLQVAARMARTLSAHAERVEQVRFDGDPEKFAGRLADCDLVLAARYHVAIASSSMGIPTLWLAYQRKVMDAAPAYGAPPDDIFDLGALCSEPLGHLRLFARVGGTDIDRSAATSAQHVRIDPTATLIGADRT